jgi:hypothetical protein
MASVKHCPAVALVMPLTPVKKPLLEISTAALKHTSLASSAQWAESVPLCEHSNHPNHTTPALALRLRCILWLPCELLDLLSRSITATVIVSPAATRTPSLSHDSTQELIPLLPATQPSPRKVPPPLQAESFKNQLQRANSEITSLLRDKNNVSHSRGPDTSSARACQSSAVQLVHAQKHPLRTACIITPLAVCNTVLCMHHLSSVLVTALHSTAQHSTAPRLTVAYPNAQSCRPV